MTVLLLERPSFWTDTRDGEAWFRALASLQRAKPEHLVGSPRAVWQHALPNALSRRTALGLFGAKSSTNETILYGCGLMAEANGAWQLSPEATHLLSLWEQKSADVLVKLAEFLVRDSVWLRCLLCRLLDGDWTLTDWQRVRASRRGITPGTSLVFSRMGEPERWLEGLERRAGQQWLERTGCDQLAVHPDVLGRDSRRDDLSLAPLTAPLHLLEAIGWMTAQGDLRLPPQIVAGLSGPTTVAAALTEITARQADIRGFVAVEPTLRGLLAMFGADPNAEAFCRWMDTLLDNSLAFGAIEVLAAVPGHGRHGRGLLGDPARKLVRWVVHQEFDEHFHNAWPALGLNRTLPSASRAAAETE